MSAIPPQDFQILRAGPPDAAAVTAVIAEAFEPLPVVAWLVPEPTARQPVLTADFRILVDHAIEHGTVHTTADTCAVAVWLPHDRADQPVPPDYEKRMAAATGPWRDRFHLLDELFAANDPLPPHHHLAFLAVRPEQQDRGFGSALLAQYHRDLDGAGTAAYLEASSERSRDLYARHGYRPYGEPFTVPDGTPFWPMWRPALEPPPPIEVFT